MPPRARISQLSSRSVVAVTLTPPLRFYFRSISCPQFQLTSVYFPLSTLQPFRYQKRGFLPHAPLCWCSSGAVDFSIFILNVLYVTLFILKASWHSCIFFKWERRTQSADLWKVPVSLWAGWILLLVWCNWTVSLICLCLIMCSEQTRDHSQFLWYQHNA